MPPGELNLGGIIYENMILSRLNLQQILLLHFGVVVPVSPAHRTPLHCKQSFSQADRDKGVASLRARGVHQCPQKMCVCIFCRWLPDARLILNQAVVVLYSNSFPNENIKWTFESKCFGVSDINQTKMYCLGNRMSLICSFHFPKYGFHMSLNSRVGNFHNFRCIWDRLSAPCPREYIAFFVSEL